MHMNETMLQDLFTEKGVVYGLFVLIVVSAIYAVRIGVPHLFSYVRELAESYQEQLREQNLFYKENLDSITSHFLQNMAAHNIWHVRHNKQLKEMSENLSDIHTTITK